MPKYIFVCGGVMSGFLYPHFLFLEFIKSSAN